MTPLPDGLLERLRAEYREMPGMRLTAAQVQRLCGIERAICQEMLDKLVAAKFLWVNAHGAYGRLPEGEVSRLRTATASLQRSRVLSRAGQASPQFATPKRPSGPGQRMVRLVPRFPSAGAQSTALSRAARRA